MKKLLQIATLLATLLAATALAVPARAAEISDASLHRLLALSGIQDLVSQFPSMLRLRMEQARQRDRFVHGTASMSGDDYRELEDTMAEAFKPAGILKAIGDAVRKSVSEQDARTMLAWYDSALGKKISKAEDDSSNPSAYREMTRSVHALLANQKRVIFAMKLDNLLHMTDMSTRFQANAAVAVFVAFSTEKNAHRPANLKAFKHRIAAGLEKKRYRIRSGVILSTVYTYRKIDMASLGKYRAFLESPAALRFNHALMTGMDVGMNADIDHMARSVESLVKRQRLQKA